MNAVRVVDLDLVLAPIADIDIAVVVDGNVAGSVELAGTSAGFTDGLENLPFGVNFWIR